ncbi:tRNA (guanine(10)-N(2))-dimethyltransferase [Candidatus Woesearchaeota archaeon]|nr:tRNA (guanine(10)-N(2))-dimethyltransferase [Candidatus Woesearchaeota archaeon]
MLPYLKEESTRIDQPKQTKISKEMDVFYNPLMKLNRDISVLLLKALNRKSMQIGLPLEGTGVRGIRFLKELPKSMMERIDFNDYSPKAVSAIKKYLKLNKVQTKKVRVFQKDANDFLLSSTGYDYIDVDPFGTPNPFLDTAVKRIARDGILAVTATDTSALAGSYPDVCLRKYWAQPMNNEQMHDVGLRILIRKVQLIGSQYEKALLPVFSYSQDHYMRIFFLNIKGKKDVDALLEQHLYFLCCSSCGSHTVSLFNSAICCNKPMLAAGPLWTGQLWDQKLVKGMIAKNTLADLRTSKLLALISGEMDIPVVGIYDLHEVARRTSAVIPKTERVLALLHNLGKKAARTHLREHSVRTDASVREIRSCFT